MNPDLSSLLTPEQHDAFKAHVAEQHALFQGGKINWLQLIAEAIAFLNQILNPPTPTPGG